MKWLCVLFILSMTTATTFSQDNTSSAVTYNVAFPVSHLNEYIGQMSLRGLGIEIKRRLRPDLTLGLTFGWNVFDQLVRNQTIEFPQGAISGTNVRSVNVYPLLVSVDYFTSQRRDETRPFFGFNVGLFSVHRRFDIGVTALTKVNWHFALAPEMGFWVPLVDNAFVVITGRFNYAFEAGESFLTTKNDYAFWGVNAGVAWEYNF